MLLQFHWFTLGAFAMMLGYMILQFTFIRRKEYLFFSLYLFLTLISFYLIIDSFEKSGRVEYLIFHASYSTIPLLSFIALLSFMQCLLEIRSRLPALNKVLVVLKAFLAVLITIDLILFWFLDEIMLHFTLANLARFIVIVTGMTGSWVMIKKVGKEGWYFLTGTVVLAISGLITTLLNTNSEATDLDTARLFNTGMFYYRTGMVIQILLFSVGVSYKSKQTEKRQAELELELLKEKFEKEIEKRKAIENTRSSIASDLHDDIGATLSSINIYSKLAADKLQNKTGSSEPLLEKIRNTTQELMNNMSDVIWSITPDEDSLSTLVLKIRNLMQELFEPLGIEYVLEESLLGHEKLSMEQKRNIYLIVKEAFNNTSKYSKATKIKVTILSNQKDLTLAVSDNGVGFDVAEMKPGNGMGNMKSRAQQIGGELSVVSSEESGTTITLKFPIEKINY